jgi:hypothetical protein
MSDAPQIDPDAVRPPGPGLDWTKTCVLTVIVLSLAAGLHFYKLGDWPWDVDEVPALYELGLVPPMEQLLLIPESQVERLPRMIPVWYTTQNLVLRVLPVDEWGTRVLSAVCGVLAIGLAVGFAARIRGPGFALSLALILLGSMCLVWLSQQNRFYTMTLFWYAATITAVLCPGRQWAMLLASVVTAALAVLSHNLMVLLFGVGWIAVAAGFCLGWAPRYVAIRATAVAATGSLIYFLYLKPMLIGWQSGGLGSHPLLSFAAHVGVPTLALGSLGSALCLVRSDDRRTFGAWAIFFGGSLAILLCLPWLPIRWYARYHVLNLVPCWVMAAYAVDAVARAIPQRLGRVAWCGCVALLLAPGLASHFQDGTRHDLRFAAEVVDRIAGDETILCDSADILAYYLPESRRVQIDYWQGKDHWPQDEFILVRSTNIWAAKEQLPGRKVEILAEKSLRRFDGLSYLTRVYRVTPLPQ